MTDVKITKGMKIKLLGDSITHGVGGTGFCQNGEPIAHGFARNPEGYCWAKTFKEYVEKEYGAELQNNACTGTKIEFIIENFDTLVSEDDDLIICTIGTNNRHHLKETGYPRTREDMGEEFYNNVLKLNEMFNSRGKKVIFIANIPASEENERDRVEFWRVLHMDDINEIYKRAAKTAGFDFISMYDLMTEYTSSHGIKIDDLLCDGLHPSDKGYDVMFELIKAALGV